MGGMDWHHAAISVEVLRELAARHPDVSVDAAIRLELGLGPRTRRTSLLRKYRDDGGNTKGGQVKSDSTKSDSTNEGVGIDRHRMEEDI